MAAPPPRTEIQVSVENMPDVDRKAKCALPIILSSVEQPEFPGIHGTCVAIRHGGQTVFVTAGHVVSKVEGTRIEIPLGFGSAQAVCEIHGIVYPVAAHEQYEAACDVAAMIPTSQPRFTEGQSEPLELLRVARMTKAQPRSLFAVCGYPRDDPAKNVIDYEQKIVAFNLYHALGTYAGPMTIEGCHTLDISTVDVGGPQGLSGSPVFRCLLNDDGSWTAAFAGVATMGVVTAGYVSRPIRPPPPPPKTEPPPPKTEPEWLLNYRREQAAPPPPKSEPGWLVNYRKRKAAAGSSPGPNAGQSPGGLITSGVTPTLPTTESSSKENPS